MPRSAAAAELPSRRDSLKWLAAGAGLAGAGLAASRLAYGQQRTCTVRWWSSQSSPEQLAAYRYQIQTFEAAHADIRVVFEPTSDEGYPAQMSAAFASGQVPGVITHLPSFAAATYWQQGLLEPFNDVIQAIGPERFYPGANRIYELEPGRYAGCGIGNAAANMFWIRRDLMQQAGIDRIPETWDELREACRKMQRGGVFGAPFPYGRNGMTSLTIVGFIHLAGGQVFTPDLEPDVNTQAAADALEFYAAMREYCPPGATSYSWGESLTAFVSGAAATGIYTGRVLVNVASQNPRIADHITCRTYPVKARGVAPWTFNGFPTVMIPRQAADKEAAKLFAAWLFREDGYVRQLLATPGHTLPALQTITRSAAYQENPLIRKYSGEVETMARAAAAGHNLGWESTRHRPNLRGGAIVASHVLAEAVQRVAVNGETPRAVLALTQDRLAELMRRT
jgi:multiple sugar transport system substrate-binding protein